MSITACVIQCILIHNDCSSLVGIYMSWVIENRAQLEEGNRRIYKQGLLASRILALEKTVSTTMTELEIDKSAADEAAKLASAVEIAPSLRTTMLERVWEKTERILGTATMWISICRVVNRDYWGKKSACTLTFHSI